MCFFGSKSAAPPAPTPAPAPLPTPTPSEISPQTAQDVKKKQLDMMRYGLASTIKTGPRGLVGTGPNLNSSNQQGKTKLGA